MMLRAILLALIFGVVWARATAWKATEWTQIANNGQLAASVSKQARIVSEQIKTAAGVLRQVAAARQNLDRIAAGEISEVLSPLGLGSYADLYKSVVSLSNAADNVYTVFTEKGTDFATSGLTWEDYVLYESALVQRRGNVYAQRLKRDLQAIEEMQRRNDAFQKVAGRTKDIHGNLQGLQHLSQLSAMSTKELMDIRAAIVAQSAAHQQKALHATAQQQRKNMVYQQTVAAAEKRVQENPINPIELDPLKGWDRLKVPAP